MHDARHSPGFFPYPCFLLGQERRRWGGAAAEDGERGMRCGVAVWNARGAVLPGETQHGAWADAPRCDARCSALRWPVHRTAPFVPRCRVMGPWCRGESGAGCRVGWLSPLAYAGSVLWRLSLRDAKMVGKYGAEPFAVRFPGLRGRITGEFCIFAAPIYM